MTGMCQVGRIVNLRGETHRGYSEENMLRPRPVERVVQSPRLSGPEYAACRDMTFGLPCPHMQLRQRQSVSSRRCSRTVQAKPFAAEPRCTVADEMQNRQSPGGTPRGQACFSFRRVVIAAAEQASDRLAIELARMLPCITTRGRRAWVTSCTTPGPHVVQCGITG